MNKLAHGMMLLAMASVVLTLATGCEDDDDDSKTTIVTNTVTKYITDGNGNVVAVDAADGGGAAAGAADGAAAGNDDLIVVDPPGGDGNNAPTLTGIWIVQMGGNTLSMQLKQNGETLEGSIKNVGEVTGRKWAGSSDVVFNTTYVDLFTTFTGSVRNENHMSGTWRNEDGERGGWKADRI